LSGPEAIIRGGPRAAAKQNRSGERKGTEKGKASSEERRETVAGPKLEMATYKKSGETGFSEPTSTSKRRTTATTERKKPEARKIQKRT